MNVDSRQIRLIQSEVTQIADDVGLRQSELNRIRSTLSKSHFDLRCEARLMGRKCRSMQKFVMINPRCPKTQVRRAVHAN